MVTGVQTCALPILIVGGEGTAITVTVIGFDSGDEQPPAIIVQV